MMCMVCGVYERGCETRCNEGIRGCNGVVMRVTWILGVDHGFRCEDGGRQIGIYPILCYPILCYAMLSYPMLCYPILSYPMLSYPILCYAMLRLRGGHCCDGRVVGMVVGYHHWSPGYWV